MRKRRASVLGFGFVLIEHRAQTVPYETYHARLLTLGGGFSVEIYAHPNPETGGDHALRYRTDREGD